MSMDINELAAESAELLPGREALGKLTFSFTKNVTKHIAVVDASNSSNVANVWSPGAEAEGAAYQSITISQ